MRELFDHRLERRRLEHHVVDDAVARRVVGGEERIVAHPVEAHVGVVAAEEHAHEAQIERAHQRDDPRAVLGDAAEGADLGAAGALDLVADRGLDALPPPGSASTARSGA